MAAPTIRHTFVDATTCDATQIMNNYNSIIEALSDGRKDLTVSAFTSESTSTFNGNITLGNASADTVTINAKLNTSISIKTNGTYDLGSSSKVMAVLTLGAADVSQDGNIYFNLSTTSYIRGDKSNTLLTIAGFTTGISITVDQGFNFFSGSAVRFKLGVSTDVIINNQINNADISFFTNKGGTDSELIKFKASSGIVFSKSWDSNLLHNPLINSNFDIWQRDVSFAACADLQYTADRWKYEKSGTLVHTVKRGASAPTANTSILKSNYDLFLDCTTAEAVIANSHYVFIGQPIEGQYYTPFEGREATLGFWVKSDKIGTYSVAFRNSGLDRSLVKEYSVVSAAVWEYKTMTVNFNYTGGTWNYTNGVGLRVGFALAAGTSFTTASINTWVNTNILASTDQTNAVDNAANNFELAQVQLNAGPFAKPFAPRHFIKELNHCKRYYENSYEYGTISMACVSTGKIMGVGPSTAVAAQDMNNVWFNVSKRTAPAMTFYTQSGNAGLCFEPNSTLITNATFVTEVTENHFSLSSFTSADGDTPYHFHYVAEAEI